MFVPEPTSSADDISSICATRVTLYRKFTLFVNQELLQQRWQIFFYTYNARKVRHQYLKEILKPEQKIELRISSSQD